MDAKAHTHHINKPGVLSLYDTLLLLLAWLLLLNSFQKSIYLHETNHRLIAAVTATNVANKAYAFHCPLWTNKGVVRPPHSTFYPRCSTSHHSLWTDKCTAWSLYSTLRMVNSHYSLLTAALPLKSPVLNDASKQSDRQYESIDSIKKLILPNSLDNLTNLKWLRGRLQRIRVLGHHAFAVLRLSKAQTIQICCVKPPAETSTQPKSAFEALTSFPIESIIDVGGWVKPAMVKSCTVKDREVHASQVELVTASGVLPFLPIRSVNTSQPSPNISSSLRYKHRWIDLRTDVSQSIMHIKAVMVQTLRRLLNAHQFIEIMTPKLLAGETQATEQIRAHEDALDYQNGGAQVFQTTYFGKPASLSQSPQLHKQMAIAADFERVFEIGPVFRAEKHHTRQHLCEYTGLDLEMILYQSYTEVLKLVYSVLVEMFQNVETNEEAHLKLVRDALGGSALALATTPVILSFQDAHRLLRTSYPSTMPCIHFSSAQERALGKLVKQKYDSDLVIIDQYPLASRPFYSMPTSDHSNFSNSYDILLRGIEVGSGSQREHRYNHLDKRIEARGLRVTPALQTYLQAIKAGCSPHGGIGLGLERLVMGYLQLPHIQQASMFPRLPNRCTP